MSLEIATHGEHTVCPFIGKYCFPENTISKSWYFNLPNEDFNMLNLGDEGCWNLWISHLTTQFKDECDMHLKDKAKARTKLCNESWRTYTTDKIRLLRLAYPKESNREICSRIRSGFNDAAADAFMVSCIKLSKMQSRAYDYDSHIAQYASFNRSFTSVPASTQQASNAQTGSSFQSGSSDNRNQQ
ncbi:hypothetical protein BJ508DRAFT_322048 [Ascobolus immersus RN42]|uniref:Retrotransposon gag domain-containing protein n=1 Tax=Ascobolus immersus RN42 TaxID=1160509 RepID=A0A3N4IIC6_ASCIM|nr:hypothetical protein BJ508DRAFT_322048 [Ascobolus immersus RN42]